METLCKSEYWFVYEAVLYAQNYCETNKLPPIYENTFKIALEFYYKTRNPDRYLNYMFFSCKESSTFKDPVSAILFQQNKTIAQMLLRHDPILVKADQFFRSTKCSNFQTLISDFCSCLREESHCGSHEQIETPFGLFPSRKIWAVWIVFSAFWIHFVEFSLFEKDQSQLTSDVFEF